MPDIMFSIIARWRLDVEIHPPDLHGVRPHGLRIVHHPELLPEVPHEPREQWSGLGVLLAYAHEHGAEYGVAQCHAVGLVEISGFELVVRPTAAGGAGNILDLG